MEPTLEAYQSPASPPLFYYGLRPLAQILNFWELVDKLKDPIDWQPDHSIGEDYYN